MNYHEIEKCSISNGTGFRTVLYVSGCSLHCKGCFNQGTWDKNSGKPFDESAKQELIESLDHPYIAGLTLTGGHPLEPYNINDIIDLMKDIKSRFPDKTIWLYTGYRFQTITTPAITDDFNPERDRYLSKRKEVLEYADVIVDGPFIEPEKDITLKFRGSSNQNIWVKQDGEWVNTTGNEGI